MTLAYHTTEAGHKLAYRQRRGEGPGVIFLGGFRSDMEASKATAIAEWCDKALIPCTRMDYFGHGKSEGEFIDYTIGRGLADVLEILDHVATGEQILIGSSMGGWLGLLAAMERRQQVKAFIGIAAAPDFSEWMRERMTPEQRTTLDDEGVLWVHSDYFNNDYPITQNFIAEGKTHLLLGDVIPLDRPVHLLQGQMDEEVPWATAIAIAEKLTSEEVTVTLVKDGDHRLSRPQDINLLLDTLARSHANLTG